MVECSICGKKMQNASLSRHMEQMNGGKKIEYEEQSTKGRGLHQIEDVKRGVSTHAPLKDVKEEDSISLECIGIFA